MIKLLKSYKWLILRRFSQVSIVLLFLSGPLFGVWIAKGNLAFSKTFDILPLTDPLVALQSLIGGVELYGDAIIGIAIVVVFYLIVGGRVYCSWVCPVNIVTDTARWLRLKLGIKSTSSIAKSTRYYLLAVILLLPLFTGVLVWELVNPVSVLFRGLIFGFGLGWLIILGVFLFDLFVAKDAWCGKLCPVGAFYGLIGKFSLLRVRADDRAKCDDCLDCYVVCPESKILRPVLKGEGKGIKPVITSELCTNCGRCIDVCDEKVFKFGTRF